MRGSGSWVIELLCVTEKREREKKQGELVFFKNKVLYNIIVATNQCQVHPYIYRNLSNEYDRQEWIETL